jgi:hypothetical protein
VQSIAKIRLVSDRRPQSPDGRTFIGSDRGHDSLATARCLNLSAEDIPMIMCGVSCTMSAGEWDWHRYLEIMLDGLRAGVQSPTDDDRRET